MSCSCTSAFSGSLALPDLILCTPNKEQSLKILHLKSAVKFEMRKDFISLDPCGGVSGNHLVIWQREDTLWRGIWCQTLLVVPEQSQEGRAPHPSCPHHTLLQWQNQQSCCSWVTWACSLVQKILRCDYFLSWWKGSVPGGRVCWVLWLEGHHCRLCWEI